MGGTFQSKTYKVEKEHKKSGSELRFKSGEKKVEKEFNNLRENIKRDINEAQKPNNQIMEDTTKNNHVFDKVKVVDNLSDNQNANKNENEVPNKPEQESENREELVSQENQFKTNGDSSQSDEKIVEGPEDIKLPYTLQNLLQEVNAEVSIENDTCKPKSLVPEDKPKENENVVEVEISEKNQTTPEDISEKNNPELKESKILNGEIVTQECCNVIVEEIKDENKIELPQDKNDSEIKECKLDANEENICEPSEKNTSRNENANEKDPLDKIEIITEPTPSNETNLNTKNVHVAMTENYTVNSSILASNESCKILNEVTSPEIKENRNIDLVNMDEINKITATSSVDCEINKENLNQKVSNEEKLSEAKNDPLLNKIFGIEREIKNFYDTVEGKGESYVLTLRELLIRSMVKLDNLEVNNELARSERKRVIKYAQSCLNSIESTE